MGVDPVSDDEPPRPRLRTFRIAAGEPLLSLPDGHRAQEPSVDDGEQDPDADEIDAD